MWWLLGAAIGAGLGAINNYEEKIRQEAEITRQRNNAKKAYNYGKENSDRLFGIQKGEALWQLGMQDRALREGMGQFTDEYNTNLLARAYGEQDARIQTASGIGASKVQEGMSGTRGNTANQLVRDYAANSLERQIDVQKKQDENTLAGTISNANRSITAMAHERDAWEPGGYRYESKKANDLYNEQMYKLGQENYQYQLDDMNSNQFLDYFTGALGGAMSGAAFANSIYNFDYEWWNPKPKSGNKIAPVGGNNGNGTFSIGSHGVHVPEGEFELQ